MVPEISALSRLPSSWEWILNGRVSAAAASAKTGFTAKVSKAAVHKGRKRKGPNSRRARAFNKTGSFGRMAVPSDSDDSLPESLAE
jgi:hypothetical protein